MKKKQTFTKVRNNLNWWGSVQFQLVQQEKNLQKTTGQMYGSEKLKTYFNDWEGI